RQLSGLRRWTNGERDDVIVHGQRAYWSAILPDHVVFGPTGRIRSPGIELVVAHDVTVHPLDPGGDGLIGQLLDGAQRIRRGRILLVRVCSTGQGRVAAAHQDQVAGSRA